MEELRKRGNDFFQQGKLEDAIRCYDQCVRSAGPNDVASCAPAHSNSSLCHFKLNQVEKALEEADSGIRCLPSHARSHFRRAEALLRMGRCGEALKSIRDGSAIDSNMFQDISEQAKKQLRLEAQFKNASRTKIAVRIVDEKSGKGLFATSSMDGEQEILRESPLFFVQHSLNMEAILACHGCMSFIGLLRQGEGKPSSRLNVPHNPFVSCKEDCDDVFCSDSCRSIHEGRHSLMCTSQKEMRNFMSLSNATTERFSLAATIIAAIVHEHRENGGKKSLNDVEHFVDYDWAKGTEYKPKEVMMGEREAFLESLSLLKSTRVYEPALDHLFTEEYYSHLIGAIERNSAVFEGIPDQKLYEKLHSKLKIELEDIPVAQGLGMFQLHSCMNHSCTPNAVVVGPRVGGTPCIFISYVDETEPHSSRHGRISENYGFSCNCHRCLHNT